MTEQPSTLQSFPFQASIEAIKISTNFESYEDFHLYMLEHLPQNSPQTRERYAELIGRRYFPGLTFDNLLTKVWQAYQDERILVDLMRVYALEAEPVIAHFVLEKVWPLAAGQVLDLAVARSFIEDTYGEFKKTSYERLLLSVRHLGFVGRYNGELIAEEIPTPADALLILLHDRLAPTPRIVRLGGILDTKWWQFLGIADAKAVRRVLHEAEAVGLIARYSTVDELEQVTTRFARDDYLSQGKRL